MLATHVLPREPAREVATVRGLGGVPCGLKPPTPLPLIPLPYSALLHALLAPKELAAVDTLGGPWPPAVPMGTQ